MLTDRDGKAALHATTVDQVCARWSDDGSLAHAGSASVAPRADQHQRDRRVLPGEGTHPVAPKGGAGLGSAGHPHPPGAQVIALMDHHGDGWAPLPGAPVHAAETVLRPAGLKTGKRAAKLTGWGLPGAALHRDGGLDAQANRQALFKAGLLPHLKEHPRHRQRPKRGRKRLGHAAMQA